MAKVRLEKKLSFKEKYEHLYKPLSFILSVIFSVYLIYIITPPTFGYMSYTLINVLL
jgi:uncharacterized membrane protein